MLAPIELPSSAVASRVASTKWLRSSPALVLIARLMRSAGREKSASRVKSPGRISAKLAMIRLWPRLTAASTFLALATTMSPPMTRSALAPELGVQRLHADAVRLHAAVAATLAHQLVDDHALVGIRIEPALAAPTFLRRAGLIVDQHARALDGGELGLHAHQLVAMVHGHAARPSDVGGIFPRLVGDDDQPLDAGGCDLAGDLRHAQPAFVGLAAGHRHRVVEQDLVGDVDARDDRRAQRQIARMIVGAVAEVLEHVAAVRERGFADPIGALAAHLGVAEGGAIHPLRHEMATDPRIGAHALRHHRRGIVRTAGAEVRRAGRHVRHLGERALALLEPGDLRRQRLVAAALEQPLADADGDVVGIERAFDREQPVAALVPLADAHRLVRGAVELLADLDLDQRTLLLDHDDEIEALRELHELALAERPRAGDLVEPDPEIVAFDLVDAELVERLAHVEVGLADGDDADPGVASAGGDVAIELVGAHERQHGIALEVVQSRFLAE